MKHRSPLAVFFLTFITLGIYGIVWYVKTKNEMKAQGTEIPTAWLLIIPFINWWWLWKYSKGVAKVSSDKMSGAVAFLLLFLLGGIGMAIVQSTFNGLGAPAASQAPASTQPAADASAPASAAPATDAAAAAPATDASAPAASSSPAPASTDQTPPASSTPPQVSG